MPHKERIPTEEKVKVVEEYLAEKGSQSDICSKYNISGRQMFRKWIKQYNSYEEFKQPNSGGVLCMAKSRKATLEERIKIVSYCIAGNKDYGKTIEQCQWQSKNAQRAGKKCTEVVSGICLFIQGIVRLNLLLHVLLSLFEAVALALDVDDGAVVQHPVKDVGSDGDVGKNVVLLGEGFVAGENGRSFLVSPRNELKEEVRAFHRMLLKYTKTKTSYPTYNAVKKPVYLSIQEIVKR